MSELPANHERFAFHKATDFHQRSRSVGVDALGCLPETRWRQSPRICDSYHGNADACIPDVYPRGFPAAPHHGLKLVGEISSHARSVRFLSMARFTFSPTSGSIVSSSSRSIPGDVVQRPFITLGMLSFFLMAPACHNLDQQDGQTAGRKTLGPAA